MAADSCQGKLRVGARWQEGAGLRLLLEEQHAVGKDVRLGHALAETLRHGAEVLADDEALVAVTLERKNADQILDRVSDISTG